MLAEYTTTVVGAYSVPRWYEALEKQVEQGLLTKEEMADAQWRASQAAIADQDSAGVDILNGGEMHRRTNNRHAPPNAMLNYFWEKIPGFAKNDRGELRTRPLNITTKDPNVLHPAAICTEKIGYGDLTLVDEHGFVATYARNPDNVKITMTGPHMLAKVTYDEYYGDMAAMMQDLAKVINRNLKELDEAGCRHVQIDEPLFAAAGVIKDEVSAAVDAINMCFEGVKATKWVHVCQGNYAVGAHYDGQIGHRYFMVEEYPTDLICRIQCDVLMNEGDMTPRYRDHLGNQQLAVGVADVQHLNVETPEDLVKQITAWAESWLPREQTLITSSCGMNHLPRHIALGKLKAMAKARDLLRAS
ncbi:MAG: hypothetical protein GEV03_28755 [Streptosporangiales bacterium]|nr:hypothetical protein [Streptosporangiales bacterium]